MVNDLVFLGIDFSNSSKIFLSIVKDDTYFLLFDLTFRDNTPPNQKENFVYLQN
jgi:hypothetical protein